MTKRELLFAQIKRQQEVGEPLPIVSLEEFFEGNNDYGSIGCNLDDPQAKPPLPVPYWPHPSPQGFYEILRAVRERQEVQDVLVEVSDTDVGEEDWPFSELVYILTTESIGEVEVWAASLHQRKYPKATKARSLLLCLIFCRAILCTHCGGTDNEVTSSGN